jgi:hypothetical protein
MKSTAQKKTVKEFAAHIGIGYKLFAQIFNGTRPPTKKQTQHLANFFNDQSFYDVVGMARDDPNLKYVQRNWGKIPPGVQQQVTQMFRPYSTEPLPKNGENETT